MARLEMPIDLTAEQSEACAEVVNGPRGKVPAPMIAWLRNPELARRLQKLGELLRYDTTLGARLTELAILVCARHWTAHVQWKAHKVYALEAGLDPQIVADIAARLTPSFQDDAERVVYDLAHALLNTGRVVGPLYGRAVARLGEPGVVELVTLLGYYCVASFTLNTFELGLPAGAAPELTDPDFQQPHLAT
jgi:4-carboxymuconolactone decarboxylase